MKELDGIPPTLQPNHVLYFGAKSWCAPCKFLHPMMESLSDEYNDVEFVYLDADVAPKVMVDYKITSVPTVIMSINGQEKVFHGLQPKSSYQAFLRNLTP